LYFFIKDKKNILLYPNRQTIALPPHVLILCSKASCSDS